MTLVELLVAASMSVVIVGASSSMLISAVHDQPKISKRAQDVSKVRWILERMTREIRNGIVVDHADAEELSIRTYVRSTSCGSSTSLAASSASIVCEVTYRCSAASKSCTRTEAAPGVYTGTSVKIFEGINDGNVFNFSPGTEDPTFVGITLRFPEPEGKGSFTITDGAALRSASLLVE
jgi:hypothetical protein